MQYSNEYNNFLKSKLIKFWIYLEKAKNDSFQFNKWVKIEKDNWSYGDYFLFNSK